MSVDAGEIVEKGGAVSTATAHIAPTGMRDQGTHARFFIASLLFALTFGASLGAVVLGSITLPWQMIAPGLLPAAKLAHAYAQVFGFATLFIMGVAYHAVPRIKGTVLKAPRLVRLSFWLQSSGVLVVCLGALIGGPIAPTASIAGLAAMVLATTAFGSVIHRTLSAGTPAPERFERYLRAGCAWLVVSLVLAFLTALGVAPLQPVVWEAALWGFVASWIFGMSLRMLPALMDTRVMQGRAGTPIFAAYEATVLLWVGVTTIEVWLDVPALRATSGALLLMAALGFVLRLGVWGPRAGAGETGDRGHVKFMITAYAWLCVALVLGPGWGAAMGLQGDAVPSLLLDLSRHAFTLGFLTQMIVGVAARVVPVFAGVTLWSPAWRDATYYVLNAAVAARGLQAVVEIAGVAEAWPYIAISGPLGLAAFVMFACNMVLTVRGRERVSRATAVAGNAPE
jgi:uncharacterized protein involved in response to NO